MKPVGTARFNRRAMLLCHEVLLKFLNVVATRHNDPSQDKAFFQHFNLKALFDIRLNVFARLAYLHILLVVFIAHSIFFKAHFLIYFGNYASKGLRQGLAATVISLVFCFDCHFDFCRPIFLFMQQRPALLVFGTIFRLLRPSHRHAGMSFGGVRRPYWGLLLRRCLPGS